MPDLDQKSAGHEATAEGANNAPIAISEHFTLKEMTKTGTGLENVPNETQKANLKTLADTILEPVRALLGSPMVIHSGFRCAQVNARVGGAKNSAHLDGRACDFHPSVMSCREGFDKIRLSAIPYDKIILEQHDGSYWIHIQIGKNGAEPRGKAYTAHVSSSGTSYLEVANDRRLPVVR